MAGIQWKLPELTPWAAWVAQSYKKSYSFKLFVAVVLLVVAIVINIIVGLLCTAALMWFARREWKHKRLKKPTLDFLIALCWWVPILSALMNWLWPFGG